MANQTTGYVVNGETANTLAEVAALLGVSKVTQKDVAEGGRFADQVSLIELEPATPKEPVSDEEFENGYPQNNPPVEPSDDTQEGNPDDNPNPEDVPEDEDQEDEHEGDNPDVTPAEIMDAMGTFDTLDELKEFIKDVDTPTLEYMAKGLQLHWEPTSNQPIYRMRIAMALHRHFFPEQFKPSEGTKKKKAKYGDFSTKDLAKMARENKVQYKKTGNDAIDRMRLIMALKQSGHLPE